jgi:tripartite-type tricarboxylate transporter receptor subunit TctC
MPRRAPTRPGWACFSRRPATRVRAAGRLVLCLLAAVSATVSTMVPALAQGEFPSRPIRLIIPAAAGGVTDIIGRQWADRIKGPLGTAYVENRAGGSGVIAVVETARAAPDGYTLLLGNSSNMAVFPLAATRQRYDPVKEFEHIAVLCVSPTAMAVHGAVPASSLQELTSWVRSNPGKLSFGSAGNGTTNHLAFEMFKQLASAPDIVHVPYKGAGPGITDLISGHIPMMSVNVTGQILELNRAGNIRVLSVNAPARLKAAPQIPTSAEQGMPALIAQLAILVSAPAGTPRAVVERIAAASRQIMADAEFQRLLRDAGMEPFETSGPEHASTFLEEERVRWGPLIKTIGLKVD